MPWQLTQSKICADIDIYLSSRSVYVTLNFSLLRHSAPCLAAATAELRRWARYMTSDWVGLAGCCNRTCRTVAETVNYSESLSTSLAVFS